MPSILSNMGQQDVIIYRQSLWGIHQMQEKKLGNVSLTDKTTISISAGFIIAFIGGIYWLTEIAFTAKANAEKIQDLVQLRRTELGIVRSDIKELTEYIHQIDGKLDVILYEQKKILKEEKK